MTQTGNSTKGSRLAHELQQGPFRVSGETPAPVMTTVQKWIEAEGQKFQFYSAEIIHVVLDEAVLEQPELHPDANSTLVLNLESLDMVRASNNHMGHIRWFCQRDPKELVGLMLDQYRGTYYREHLNQLIYSSDRELEIYDLPHGIEQDTTLLAAVCAAREAGIKAETIRTQLIQSADGLTRLQTAISSTVNAHSHF